jgi:poly-gamma-glutamate capsule biosynthesis protein CapA/YwtB (metallophosphatase superfamily)
VRLCAGGDVSLGTNLDTSWTALAGKRLHRRVAALPDPDSLLFALRPLVSDADVVLLNVEGAIGEGDAPRKCGRRSTGCFALRQPVSVAAALRRFGGEVPVVGNVANNHARDAGLSGFAETLRRLDDAGVIVTGADTLATVVVTAAGDTLAFLGFSSSGVPDVRDTAAVRRHVRRAADAYGRVVVTAHLGAEGAAAQRTRDVNERYFGAGRGNPVAFARAALDGGAAIVIGHGPHVMRAMEWQGGHLVAYSLGNLATYGPFQLRDPLDRGAILCATLGTDGRATDVVVESTRQTKPGIPAPDASGRAAHLADQLGRTDFPRSGARIDRDGRVHQPR